MRRLALMLMLPGILVAEAGQTASRRPRRRAPVTGCRAVTAAMLSGPLVLTEGCYTVNQFATVGTNIFFER